MRRIPGHLKVIRGNPGHRPIPAEPEPEIPENMPAPPDFLAPLAKDEWWSIGPHLVRLGLLTAVDLACFAVYCQSVADWRAAREVLASMAERDPTTHALLVKRGSDGSPMRNPLVTIASNAANDMLRYASEFGLTPVARSRIASGGGYEPPGGKFTGLIGG
jgi:P27 family predicted phage terminase small subunit